MPLGDNYQFEQDLEKRSLNGAYIYLLAWLLIGFSINYNESQSQLFWGGSAILLLLGVSRLVSYRFSATLMQLSRKLWYSLFVINALVPPLFYGSVFALTMVRPEHESLFIYMLMAVLALLGGGIVSFSTHRGVANAYLLVVTLPTLLCIVFLPIDRGIEGTMLVLYMVFMFFQIRRLNQEYRLRINQRLELEKLTKIDSLTGIYNRRYFDEALRLYWKSHLRVQHPLALLLIDIDKFKRVNDQYGHPAGDEVIREVARSIDKAFRRETDIVARIGGEEFAVLISQTEADFVDTCAEDIRREIEGKPVVFEGQTISISVSIGAVSLIPQEGMARSEFYKAADDCLYQAKEQGRNRVVSQNQQAPPMEVQLTGSE